MNISKTLTRKIINQLINLGKWYTGIDNMGIDSLIIISLIMILVAINRKLDQDQTIEINLNKIIGDITK